MEKKILLKNALDIECRRLIQKLSAIYYALFVGVLSFVITWVFKPIFQTEGYIIIFGFVIFLLNELDKTKKELQEKIKNIKELK